MELLNNILPREVVSKIRVYHSHPVADLVKQSIKFYVKRLQVENVHGCAFDRGCSDAYYGRSYDPHIWGAVGTPGQGRIESDNMTPMQILEYELGFDTEKDRKFPDDSDTDSDSDSDQSELMCNCPDGCRVHNLISQS